MDIKMNRYMRQASYTAAAGERTSESHAGGKVESEVKTGTNRDTVSISVAGQQFFAEQMESATDMGLLHIGSDLDEFRNAVRSMNEKLPVSWKAKVDPYNTITNIAKIDKRVYLITGDLGYVVLDKFRQACPDRYINVGIAEQNMTALAAGMAKEGSIVFTYSIGNFPTLRCIEQIRNDVCYHHRNVKILAVGGGFVYGNQGVTHHATEDLAMMRVLPEMRVYVPGDVYEAIACIRDAYEYDGPAYIRLARNKETSFHNVGEAIDINKLLFLAPAGKQINIITAGTVLCEGIELQKELKKKGYSVGLVSIPKIKPIDKAGIEKLSKECDLIVTMEEHQNVGGLGGICAEIISGISGKKATLYRAGLNDQFSEITGDQQYLREYYGILKQITGNALQ